MAGPEVTQLPAKLFSVCPLFTPAELFVIMTRTADAGAAPAFRRINPRLTFVNLVKTGFL